MESDKSRKMIVDAEARCAQWLGDANEAEERGDHKKAEKCFAKVQYWLDRANKLRGWN